MARNVIQTKTRMLSIAASRNLCLQAREVTIQTLAQWTTLRVVRVGFRHHDEVPRGQRLLHSKRLPREPLQSVAVDRSFCNPSRDREAEPRDVTRARTRKDREELVARANRVREDAPEFLRRVETLSGRERCGARRGR